MKPSDSRICPSCGARNKAKWEFCVRCSESLQDVPLESAQAKAAGVEPGETGSAEAAVTPGFWITTATGFVVLMAAGVYTARNFAGEPARPDPGIFTLPVVNQATPPPAPPVRPATPAQKKLDEARRLLVRGRAAEALALFAEIAGELSDDAPFHSIHAQALWQTGDKERAVDEYRQAVRLAPGTISYRADLSKALAASGQTVAAKAEYEALVRLDPDSPGYLRDLATLYTQGGDFAAAVPLLSHAAELQFANPAILQDLAHALDKTGDRAKAVEVYQKIVDSYPTAATARSLLADLMLREGRRDEAVTLLKSGIELSPSVPGLHRTLGGVYERAGNVPEAAAEYREYARLAPNASDARGLVERAAYLEQGGTPASSS